MSIYMVCYSWNCRWVRAVDEFFGVLGTNPFIKGRQKVRIALLLNFNILVVVLQEELSLMYDLVINYSANMD